MCVFFFFYLWVLTLQNLFYSGCPHPATSPSWTANPEPVGFVCSTVNMDGTLYDAMGKGCTKTSHFYPSHALLSLSVFVFLN